MTYTCIQDWLRHRRQRWQRENNPYLIVSRITAADSTGPPVTSTTIQDSIRPLGISVSRLRADRIYDEARHTADPVHLMRLFGIGADTAMRYITAAHPDRAT